MGGTGETWNLGGVCGFPRAARTLVLLLAFSEVPVGLLVFLYLVQNFSQLCLQAAIFGPL